MLAKKSNPIAPSTQDRALEQATDNSGNPLDEPMTIVFQKIHQGGWMYVNA